MVVAWFIAFAFKWRRLRMRATLFVSYTKTHSEHRARSWMQKDRKIEWITATKTKTTNNQQSVQLEPAMGFADNNNNNIFFTTCRRLGPKNSNSKSSMLCVSFSAQLLLPNQMNMDLTVALLLDIRLFAYIYAYTGRLLAKTTIVDWLFNK